MFRYSSDQSLLLDLPPANTDLDLLARIPGVVNLHPAYASTLIVFDPLQTTHAEVERAAAALAQKPATSGAHHEIPVLYNGPDLESVAQLHNLTPTQLIELHSGALYTVAFLGFVPGFAYLSGLPPALHTPRLPSPRKSVPAGSVAIAGDQAGIYPLATPGGWQLLGTTTVTLFDPARTPMSLLQPQDTVRFQPV